MYKQQKGITLIALVVTIIVLLILAGVTIAMLSGQNGVLTNAQKSRRETEEAQTREQINLTLNAIKTEIYAQQLDDSSVVNETTNEATTTNKGKNYSGFTWNGTTATLDTHITDVITKDLKGAQQLTTNTPASLDALSSDTNIKDKIYYYKLDAKAADMKTVGTGVDNSATLTILYKDSTNDFVAMGSIILSNTTTKIVITAATSQQMTTT